MLIAIHPVNPEERKLEQVVSALRGGGVVVYPTDTVYGIGCDITNPGAMQRVLRYKDVNLRKTSLSFICHNLSYASQFLKPLDSRTFRLLKKNTPGPFTFILEANSNVPKLFRANKRTVGVRVPDSLIVRSLVERLGNPILSASVKDGDPDAEEPYMRDASLIEETLGGTADLVIDGGEGGTVGSTVVDCTGGDWTVIRQGLGVLDDNV